MVQPNQHTEQILIMKLAIFNGQYMLMVHRDDLQFRHKISMDFSQSFQLISMDFIEIFIFETVLTIFSRSYLRLQMEFSIGHTFLALLRERLVLN